MIAMLALPVDVDDCKPAFEGTFANPFLQPTTTYH